MTRFLAIYAVMVVVAALLAAWSGCPSLFRLPPDSGLLAGSLLAAVLVAAIVVGGGRALESVPWYRNMAAFLKRLLTSQEMLGPKLDTQRALVLAVYSSVGEEALFRGFVQPWLIARAGSLLEQPDTLLATALGIVGASLVFGALHFPVVRELIPWTVFAILAGVAFGVLAAWSQSLLAPVLAHLLINWLNLKRITELRFEDPPGANPPLA